MYIIYSIRQSAWVTRAGTYTSRIEEAKQIPSRPEVIKVCASHSYNRGMDWMPVLLEDITFLQATIK